MIPTEYESFEQVVTVGCVNLTPVQPIFPMREWRAGRQLDASRLIAEEFRKLAEG